MQNLHTFKIQMGQMFDWKEFGPGGFQIRQVRQGRPQKKTPEWMMNDKEVQEFLTRVFPLHRKNWKQHRNAALWAAVIVLHFRAKMNNAAVVEELNTWLTKNVQHYKVTPHRITQIAYEIRKVAAGLRSDGKPRSARKAGRPKKSSKTGPTAQSASNHTVTT